MSVPWVWALAGYLIGGIPFGLILSKTFAGVDPRTVGSGNIGATNVIRAAGKKIGLLTGLLDILKSLVPVLVAQRMAGVDTALWVALAAVLGHCFTPYLKFRGGKGVATTFGSYIALNWLVALGGFLVWLATLFTFGYVSLASMVAGVALALLLIWQMPGHPLAAGISLTIALVIILRHHSNIRRLLQGKEPRISRHLLP